MDIEREREREKEKERERERGERERDNEYRLRPFPFSESPVAPASRSSRSCAPVFQQLIPIKNEAALDAPVFWATDLHESLLLLAIETTSLQ